VSSYTILLINNKLSLVVWLLGGSGYYVFFLFLMFLQFLPCYLVVSMDSRFLVAEKFIYPLLVTSLLDSKSMLVW
jgi:hypothetical protein